MPNGKDASAASPTTGGKQAAETTPRALDYILVRHMARNPRTRTLRAARSGHRRQGVLLDDGTRIRKKGRKRFTEVALTTMVDNHQRLLEYLRVGTLEACDPRTERPLEYEEVLSLIKNLGSDQKEFTLDDSGVQQDTVDGSDNPENFAPPPSPKKPSKGGSPPKVEQAAPPKEEGHTEGELLAMKLDELKLVAVNTYGVDKDAVSSMRAKREVVTAIFAQSEE